MGHSKLSVACCTETSPPSKQATTSSPFAWQVPLWRGSALLLAKQKENHQVRCIIKDGIVHKLRQLSYISKALFLKGRAWSTSALVTPTVTVSYTLVSHTSRSADFVFIYFRERIYRMHTRSDILFLLKKVSEKFRLRNRLLRFFPYYLFFSSFTLPCVRVDLINEKLVSILKWPKGTVVFLRLFIIYLFPFFSY